jgi:hypothetical protein
LIDIDSGMPDPVRWVTNKEIRAVLPMKKLPTIAVVTTPTRFQGLLARWGTAGQAKFRLKQAVAHRQLSRGSQPSRQSSSDSVPSVPALQAQQALQDMDFASYQEEDAMYQSSVDKVRNSLDELNLGYPIAQVERKYLPTYEFRNAELVVVIGPDGLVANTAKYVGDLPIIGINPNPGKIDGVLLPFRAQQLKSVVHAVLKGKHREQRVTMAEAQLNDGQTLRAFNDLFIGRRTHVSARYSIRYGEKIESQSSSGVIVATGAGSTGWLSSIFNMAKGISGMPTQSQYLHLNKPGSKGSFDHWSARQLTWVVREPFASNVSQADMVIGEIHADGELILESLMPEGGVIFSDGIETDFLEFNSGTSVSIQIARQQARIVVPN